MTIITIYKLQITNYLQKLLTFQTSFGLDKFKLN
jgi:hypothetical protein